MQCKQCNRQTYVSYTCPYCKEYYCNGHVEPRTHKCTGYNSQNQPTPSPRERRLQHATGTREKQVTHPSTFGTIQRKVFIATIVLLITEETLRLVSYVRNSPSLELNIYVAVASMWLTPYVASSTIFLSACLIVLVTRKTLDNRSAKDTHVDLLKKATSIGIYSIMAIINIFSISGWIFVLLI